MDRIYDCGDEVLIVFCYKNQPLLRVKMGKKRLLTLSLAIQRVLPGRVENTF